MPQQGLADAVDIAAGRQIHHRVGAVVYRGVQLLQLLLHVRAHRRIADVGVDLAQRIHADAHRLQLGMVDVGRNDQLAFGNFGAHQLRRDLLALGHVQHLFGDQSFARKVHLGHVAVAAARRLFPPPRNPLLAQFRNSLGGNFVWRDAARFRCRLIRRFHSFLPTPSCALSAHYTMRACCKDAASPESVQSVFSASNQQAGMS